MSDPARESFIAGPVHAGAALPAWLQAGREAAREAFLAGGFPTLRQEEWKYTDVRPIASRRFRIAGGGGAAGGRAGAVIDTLRLEAARGRELVFVDGRFATALSGTTQAPAGAVIRPLSAAIAASPDFLREHLTRHADIRRNGFVALNTAQIGDGGVVHVADDAVLDLPVHFLFAAGGDAGTAVAAYPRNLIVLGRNARATVVETHAGPDGCEYLSNAITEIVLAPGAALEYYRLQQEGTGAFHIGSVFVRQERDSRLVSHSLSLGGALARTDLDVRLAGEGASAHLNGLYVCGGRQHVDNHLRVDHLAPRTVSEETYRGVLDGRARAVFNGKVVVHRDAGKTDARQSNANLLLSDDAEVDTKPELEIYADDVKCSHGATVGRLDADMLFYLRSRAIPEPVARSLLVFAFAEDLIRRIGIGSIRARIERTVAGRLPDAGLIAEFLQ
jgi:Fe-S cluster assembly protein SufD